MLKSILSIPSALLFLQTVALCGQSTASASAIPSIQVIQNLHFGGLLVEPQGGSAVLTADGALLTQGPGVSVSARPPSALARFRLNGPPKAVFHLQLTPTTPQLTGVNGCALRVAEFEASLRSWSGTFSDAGEAELKVGGRLDIPANSLSGSYLSAPIQLRMTVANVPEPSTVSVSFTIQASITAPLKLANVRGMDFGALIPGSAPGVFELQPTGAHRGIGVSAPTLLRSSVPSPATFSLQGPAGACFSIRLPAETYLQGPGTPIRVHDFTCDRPLQGSLPTGGLLFNVGASLTLGPEQAFGAYRGTFTVEVNYP